MAAFEAISKVIVQTIGRGADIDLIDVRNAKLPRDRPPITKFDPRNYRTPRIEIKPWMAYFNLLRNAFGTSVLGASMSISQVGVLMGPLLIILTGLLVIHTHMMLLHYRGIYDVKSDCHMCAVVLFTADNLRDVADWESNIPSIIVLFFPYFIMEIFMKNLRIISKLILAGNILNVFGFILVIYHILLRGGGDDMKWLPHGWVALLNAFGTTLFNLSAVGVVLSCEKALKNPRIMTQKHGAVQIGMLAPTITSLLVGSAGYYAFGGMEENILRYLPFDDFSALICITFYMITTALSYPLQCYPCIQIIIEVIKNHDPFVTPTNACILGVDYIARPIFVISTFMLAYFVPVQGPLVAFIGSFCTTLLVLVFPALMEIGLCYPDFYGRYNYILIKDILIVLLGLVSWMTGVFLCGYLIYVRLLSITLHEEYL